MKNKCLLLVFTFFLWTLVFVLQKPIFLILYGGVPQLFQVIYHGLPLDLSMAGYLTVVPGLVLLVSCVPLNIRQGDTGIKIMRGIMKVWFAIGLFLYGITFVANLVLYPYWGFPLDSTPLFFILSSPSAAMASIEPWQMVLGIGATAAAMYCASLIFRPVWMKYGKAAFEEEPKAWSGVPILILDALLFLPIRGGVTVSTMNTGKAYFSQNHVLNHAAVNPMFSIMESLAHQENFGEQYRFMDDHEAHRLFNKLHGHAMHTTEVLKTKRPDIYIVILESFSDTLTHQPKVTPNLNALKHEGIYFSRFYANGYRTDRGLVSILLGYPAPGTVSLMKYPSKTAKIASIAAHLTHVGYNTHYYYGGDADFTNMRSFLFNQGFRNIIEDVDFPVSDRLSKWGVPDHLLFKRAKSDIARWNSHHPQFTVIQTSSSHEPFDVPYHKLNDKILNAFSYTDDCIGRFMKFLKSTNRWNNSLVIFIPDHLGAWPEKIDNFASWRFHVPMIWVGGAVKKPMVVDTFGSQQDIAATLLGQLGIGHNDMPYSKDLLDPGVYHYAYFMPNDGFGMITEDNEVIYDNKLMRSVVDNGKAKGKNLKYGQAILQVLFDDIAEK